MNRVIAGMEKVCQVLSVFFVAIVFVVSTALFVGIPQANANEMTPEAAAYQVADRSTTPRGGDAELKTQQRRSGEAYESAKDLTPEASDYEVDGKDFSARVRSSRDNAPLGSNDLGRDVKQNFKDATDTVREKLNLDEPIYPGTKEFINDVEERVEGAVETITGKRD
jgi:hypothetical protein